MHNIDDGTRDDASATVSGSNPISDIVQAVERAGKGGGSRHQPSSFRHTQCLARFVQALMVLSSSNHALEHSKQSEIDMDLVPPWMRRQTAWP